MATSAFRPDSGPAYSAGSSAAFQELCADLRPLISGGRIEYSESIVPYELNAVITAQLDNFLGLAGMENRVKNGERDNRRYGITMTPDPGEDDRFTLVMLYGEGDESIEMHFDLVMQGPNTTITSFHSDFSGTEIMYGRLGMADPQSGEYSYSVTAAGGLGGEENIGALLNAVTNSILSVDEETEIVPVAQEFLPAEYLDELPGPEALAIVMQADFEKRGLSSTDLITLLLEPSDPSELFAELNITFHTDPRSEIRAYMSVNPLFKHISGLLRNTTAMLGHLVQYINEEWARYILNFEFQQDGLLYKVTLPNGESSMLSDQQVELLSKVLKAYKFLNENGRLLQGD